MARLPPTRRGAWHSEETDCQSLSLASFQGEVRLEARLEVVVLHTAALNRVVVVVLTPLPLACRGQSKRESISLISVISVSNSVSQSVLVIVPASASILFSNDQIS